jgi:hypothetical protein
MKIAYYFASYRDREDAKESLRIFNDVVPEGCEMYNVFRFKFPFLDEEKFSDLKTYSLYDNFEDVNEDEIEKLEKSITIQPHKTDAHGLNFPLSQHAYPTQR